MIITLSPETEALLQQKAEREGTDVSTAAGALLAAALQWEAQEQAETIEGVHRGIEAGDAGRVRPFAEFAARMREKHRLPVHLSDEEIGADR